jgi:hypothetical protein
LKAHDAFPFVENCTWLAAGRPDRSPIPDPHSGSAVKAPFGVYAKVGQPGRIQAGHAVELLD